MSLQPHIQASIASRIKFLDPVRFGSPYRFPILATTTVIGFWIGKFAARYIRDHNPNRFSQSNWAIMRNAHRIYNHLFPINSARRYFIEVVLPDNFLLGLHIELHLHTMSYPIERPGSVLDEVGNAILRTFFFACCLDKIRQIAYEIIRRIPSYYAFPFAVSYAPTGIYRETFPNGQYIDHRN